MNQLEVMNFLNEISSVFPEAISLASGRPNSNLFQMDDLMAFQNKFIDYFAGEKNISTEKAKELLYQYGPSSGLIGTVLAKHLKVDENIVVMPENIVVTNGCQEALALICINELKQDMDCMLTFDPSYIGFSGLIQSLGKVVKPIHCTFDNEQDLDTLQQDFEAQVLLIKSQGYNPKAIYVNGDFNNPLSYRLSKAQKEILLNACSNLKVKLIEDNPYGMFSYSDDKSCTIRALDTNNIVYYIGSFSKTLCPALRVGYLIIPENNKREKEEIVALKSLISINTSQICQSIVAGFLIDNEYSLMSSMQIMLIKYKAQRDAMLKALDENLEGEQRITWNKPEGGFFIVLSLPFDVVEEDVYECARNFGVIFMPISFFTLEEGNNKRLVRLAFSNFESEEITQGVVRFSQYLCDKLERNL